MKPFDYVYKFINTILPKSHRDEIIGDLYELEEILILKKYSKIKILKKILIIGFISGLGLRLNSFENYLIKIKNLIYLQLEYIDNFILTGKTQKNKRKKLKRYSKNTKYKNSYLLNKYQLKKFLNKIYRSRLKINQNLLMIIIWITSMIITYSVHIPIINNMGNNHHYSSNRLK